MHEGRRKQKKRHLIRYISYSILFILFLYAVTLKRSDFKLVHGIIWQPTNDYPLPEGNWHLLGADTLIVQWSLNDGLAWVANTGFDVQPSVPDWNSLLQEPWARRLILGLASRMQLEEARNDWAVLAAQSADFATRLANFEPIAGWYAPIEISPDWDNPIGRESYIKTLPRPLYVSVYGGYDMTPDEFAEWVSSWLPQDANVLLQDGVGAAAQTPVNARLRADALASRLGKDRVSIILEAFQPDEQGGFHSARVSQMIQQIRNYESYKVYIFSARHLGPIQVYGLFLLGPLL